MVIVDKFPITIKEISKCVVEVDANNYDEAKEKIEKLYWNNPSKFVLEPYDTYFE